MCKIIDVDSPVGNDGFLDFKYLIKGMAQIYGDVIINFWLEKDEEMISSGQDTIYLGAFEEKTEVTKIFIPKDLETGSYEFNVQVTFENYQATSHRTVFVEQGEEIKVTLEEPKGQSPDVIWWVIILLSIYMIIYFKRIEINKIIRDVLKILKNEKDPKSKLEEPNLILQKEIFKEMVKKDKDSILQKRISKDMLKKKKDSTLQEKISKDMVKDKKNSTLQEIILKEETREKNKKTDGRKLIKGLLKAVLSKKKDKKR